MTRNRAIYLAVALPIVLLLAASLLGPSRMLPTSSPAQVDPATLPNAWDPSGLLALAALASDRTAGGEWDQAQALLGLLDSATIPPDQLATAKQLRQQLLDLTASLQRLQVLTANGATGLEGQQLAKTDCALSEARATAAKAAAQQQQVGVTLQSLAQRFGVATAPAVSPLSRYFAQVQALIPRIGARRQTSDDVQAAQSRQLAAAESPLQPTRLDATLANGSALVGGQVEILGKLSSGQTGLAGRTVTVTFDQQGGGAGTTTDDGAFRVELTVPAIYALSVPLCVSYTPTGVDQGRFAAAGLGLTLGTKFFETRVDASLPDTAQAGQMLTIRGEVVDSAGTAAPRLLTLLWDDQPRAAFQVSGSFATDFAVPADSPSGRHTLRLVAAATGPRAAGGFLQTMTVQRPPARVEPPALPLC